MQNQSIEQLGREIDSHLDGLGVIELKISPAINFVLWLVLWLSVGYRWWTALLLVAALQITFWVLTVKYTNWYLRRRAERLRQERPPGSNEHLEALKSLAKGPDFQLRDQFIIEASGLEERDYKPGLQFLRQMARDVKQGKDAKTVINEWGALLRQENEFLGEEFMENCRDLLADEKKTQAELISEAAKMFQIKLTLETQAPGERSKEFSHSVPVLWVLYDFIAKDELKEAA